MSGAKVKQSLVQGTCSSGRRVSYEDAALFLSRCRARPERMRTLCSTKAARQGGESLVVSVEVAPGGPEVEVREISMADGWTGCRFSPAALWLALAIAKPEGFIAKARRPELLDGTLPTALELGCGVALAGLAAHALCYHTTLTDCLPGHLRSLLQRVQAPPGETPASSAETGSEGRCRSEAAAELRVRCLDWIEDVGQDACQRGIDKGSPENRATAGPEWERLAPESLRSFDLVLASDVLYEEHHAMLLPLVLERWLRPGGCWAMSFAIRDEDMLCAFLTNLHAAGLLEENSECMSWETSCLADRCNYCSKQQGTGRAVAGQGPSLAELQEVVRGHEGGAILLQGRRPSQERKCNATSESGYGATQESNQRSLES
ncbi:unnamed protein product [Polarella glacialis]|uniref:Calmodulin-lysine N-methyltransferase n=1 Tax=Polarella glacialis TaxID=89957 RepID=A0A813FE53_POLGL|nr:unnamed protein product [Polarella glacialis]